MASSKDDLIQNIVEMQQEMMQTFQDFLVTTQPLPSLNAEVWRPPTDVLDNDDSIVVTLEIPGVGPEDMQIAVEDQRLIVQGRRKRPARKQKMQFQQMEVNYGQFQRTIALSSPVVEDNVQANYSGGFLEIHLPKVAVKKATRVVIRKSQRKSRPERRDPSAEQSRPEDERFLDHRCHHSGSRPQLLHVRDDRERGCELP